MKRFWVKAETTFGPGGLGVALDGKPVRLPGGAPLVVPSPDLAEFVADEWQAAPDSFSWDDLPFTRLLGTAQERIAPDPGPVVDGIARYGESDLLCYRADDAALAARQAAAWDPLLGWAATVLGATLRVTVGLMPIAQPPAALWALRHAVARETPIGLAALGAIVPALGSLVLGLALLHRRLGPEEAVALGFLDEAFQAEFWGRDEEAASRQDRIAAEVCVAAKAALVAR